MTTIGRTPRRASGIRLLALAGAILMALALPARATRADIPAPGTAPVRNEVLFDWGPLDGRIARPVAAIAGDTWESLATRETASAAWAPTIRALNGGGDAPKPDGEAWVPPRTLAFGAKEAFFAVYLDSAKFGRGSDVSSTGFHALDPTRATHDVFGEITLAVLPIHGPDAATAAASIPRNRASATLRDRPSGVRIVELGRATDSVQVADPLRRVEWTWRCASLATDGAVSFTLAREARFDAKGAPLGESGRGGGAPPSLSSGILVGAVVLLALVTLLVVRRQRARRRLRAADAEWRRLNPSGDAAR